MGDDLVGVCDACLGEAADGDGVLKVDTAAAERALRARRARAGADPQMLFRLTPGEVDGPSPRLRYRAGVRLHDRCRTHPALDRTCWNVHLVDKPFLAATDWADFLECTPHPRRAAASGILPRTPKDPEWWAGR
ncbi:hypothetical protein [Streptomyces violascens]|uniref:hypothetical protein n=1 Tax=Streptomyces violascens TaxID=67381 RepID=UPI00365C4BA5